MRPVLVRADAAPIAGESKTGRPQVKQGGKGTQGGSGKLAYRPGWHLGVVPDDTMFKAYIQEQVVAVINKILRLEK